MGGLTSYQLILIVILVLWPLAITALLLVMSKLETYVNRSDADTPQEAGLEPISGHSSEKEVKIVFGDTVVGDSK
jgi:NADH:ubiquinone oxidoreductase subunit 3 (subunit A)